MDLTFSELRRANQLRQSALSRRYDSLESSEKWSSSALLQSLVSELGEYAQVKDKMMRGRIDRDQTAIASELADVATCLDLLAASEGVDLGEAIRCKWNEVSNRLELPMRLGEYSMSREIE